MILVVGVQLLGLIAAIAASAQESAVLRLLVNTEDRGDTFAVVAPDGDVLLPRSTLTEVGLQEVPPGEMANGVPHVSLRTLAPDVTFVLDARTGTLSLTVEPGRFARTTRDYFFHTPPPSLVETSANSAFLNYGLLVADADSFLGTAEVAGMWNGWLGQSTFAYANDETGEHFTRLLTNLTHDSTEDQRRITIGDVSAFSGLLGSGQVMGGIGVSRDFGLTPYFYPTPGLDLSGVLQTPSEVETYVNGQLVKRETLGAGEFTLQNVPVNNGLNNTTIVIRDAFQRVTRIDAPFYLAAQLLKEGLSDYSYNVGFRRDELGLESAAYGPWQASAYHRYGWTPWLTAGLRGELSAQIMNGGPIANLSLDPYGQLDASLALSRDSSAVGYGFLSSYTYINSYVYARLSMQYLSRDYANLALDAEMERQKLSWLASVGASRAPFGSLTLTYAESSSYVEPTSRQVSAFYSRPLAGPVHLQLSVTQTLDPIPTTGVFVGLTISLGLQHGVLLTHQMRDGDNVQTAVLEKNTPLGPGLSYRFQGSRGDLAGTSTDYGTDDFLQYQGRYGTVGASFREADGELSHDLRLAGSVSWIDSGVHLSRPIQDSFALVRVPGLEDVEVAYSNQPMGTTDGEGELLVPELISYLGNDLSIDPNNLPVQYRIDEVRRSIAPAFRSGALVQFEVLKLQAFVGRLLLRVEGHEETGDFAALTVALPGQEPSVGVVGTGGEFYLENLPAGRLPVQVEWRGHAGSCELTIPASQEIQVDLGTVSCALP